MWGLVSGECDGTGDSYASIAQRLSTHRRAFYTCMTLDFEVGNGGFHQFFWNTEGGLNSLLEQDLALVRAWDHLALFGEALQLCREHGLIDAKRGGENTWEEFTAGYDTIPWDPLDDRYYSIRPKLPALLCAFIRANLAAFS